MFVFESTTFQRHSSQVTLLTWCWATTTLTTQNYIWTLGYLPYSKTCPSVLPFAAALHARVWSQFCSPLIRYHWEVGLPIRLPIEHHLIKVLSETELKTHDLVIPIPSSASSARSLCLLILTQSSVTPENMETTLSRLQHFESLTGGTDSAIIFPLFSAQGSMGSTSYQSLPFQTPLHAFTQAQLLLMDQLINIPILPLSTPASLPKVINTFITSLNASLAVSAALQPVSATVHVLPYATSSGTMSRETSMAMTGMFTCMRDLAGMGVGDEAKEILVRGGVKQGEANDCMQFWAEEWICE